MTSDRATSAASVRLRISNELETIAFVRMIARSILPNLDELNEPLFFGALTEVISNAINEHNRQGNGADVEITIDIASQATIVVTDFGDGFDPSEEFSSTGESGRGLTITRAVVPGLSIESSASGTTISLPYPCSNS